MKKHRQNLICHLIEAYEIKTQEELTEKLNEQGVNTTQATVSRDIKELSLVKMPAVSGDSKYALPIATEEMGFTPKLKMIFRECVKRIDIAQNIVVIKTLNGMANAAAYGLDAIKDEGIVGTIAGDDTIFVLLRDNEKAAEFKTFVEDVLK